MKTTGQSTAVDETTLSKLIKNLPEATHALTCSEVKQQEIDLAEIINCDHFSNSDRLLHVTAYLLKFVNNLKKSQSKYTTARKEDVIDFEGLQ